MGLSEHLREMKSSGDMTRCAQVSVVTNSTGIMDEKQPHMPVINYTKSLGGGESSLWPTDGHTVPGQAS